MNKYRVILRNGFAAEAQAPNLIAAWLKLAEEAKPAIGYFTYGDPLLDAYIEENGRTIWKSHPHRLKESRSKNYFVTPKGPAPARIMSGAGVAEIAQQLTSEGLKPRGIVDLELIATALREHPDMRIVEREDLSNAERADDRNMLRSLRVAGIPVLSAPEGYDDILGWNGRALAAAEDATALANIRRLTNAMRQATSIAQEVRTWRWGFVTWYEYEPPIYGRG